MNLFELILAGLIGISLFQGLQVLRRDPGGVLNRIHAALCIANALWATSVLAVTALDPGSDPDWLWSWYRIGALGWCLIPALFLHFCFRLAGHPGGYQLRAGYFAGATFFCINLFEPVLASGFQTGPWGTALVHDPCRPLYLLFVAFNIAAIVTSVVCLFRWGKRGREKKQARIIAWSAIVTLCAVFFSSLVLPRIVPGIPAPGSLLTLVTLFGIWYAVRRHRLLAMDPGIAASEIMMRMMDMLFIVDEEGRIVDANPQVVQNLGYRVSEIRKRSIEEVVFEKERLREELAAIHRQPTLCARFMAHLVASSGVRLPVVLFLSLVADRYGTVAGGVVVAHDMRGTLQLEEEIAERSKAEASLKILMHELETERNLLRRRNGIMEQELDLARRIQLQFVPHASPGPGLAFAYLPMSKVGGDFFDFVRTGDPDELGVFISDVSGHGVPAALITSMVKAFLLKAGGLAGDPAALMDALNTALTGQTGGNFITAWYGVVNYRTGLLEFTNAGHGDPWLLSEGRVSRLSACWHNLPLAVMDAGHLVEMKREYRTSQLGLPRRSRILLCTDGLLESAPHEDPQDFFGGGLLEEAFAASSRLEPAGCIEAILTRLAEHRGGTDYEDDVCVICLDLGPLDTR